MRKVKQHGMLRWKNRDLCLNLLLSKLVGSQQRDIRQHWPGAGRGCGIRLRLGVNTDVRCEGKQQRRSFLV